MEQGYIKLYRSMQDWEFYTDANTMRVFIHLLLQAQHKPTICDGVQLEPGQAIITTKEIAEELELSPKQVRTALEKLQRAKETATSRAKKKTLVTIKKWAFYQATEAIEGNKKGNKKGNNPYISTIRSNMSNSTYKNDYIGKNTKKGVPPTLEEVRQYFADKGFTISAEQFFEYYEAGDWHDAKGNKVKNWKQKAITWNRKEQERNNDSNRVTEGAKSTQKPDGWDIIFG